jgi:XRE family transcriptional regulator, fatty acid utilization regulator
MGERPERATSLRVGARIRALRRKDGVSQAALASRLGISSSYLNLIENNHRAIPATLLIKLAELFALDVRAFSPSEDARAISELLEVFADPMFEAADLASADVRDLAQANPALGRAVLQLYRAYRETRGESDTLASRLAEGEEGLAPENATHLPIQRHRNYFPELETAAESLALANGELQQALTRFLEEQCWVKVKIVGFAEAHGMLRRYQERERTLVLSELLPTRSRTFQLAHQIALLHHGELLDRLASAPDLRSDTSRTLMRVALANYFASAVIMPYAPFLRAAKEVRYDIDVLGRRFRVGFEQVAHRLTTLRRPGHEGVPFHMIRIDVAGNISKRFSASGIRFARYSGACARWNIFHAFQTPGMIRVQLSRMFDGATFFCIARTIQKDSGGYHTQSPVLGLGLGCEVAYAQELVYSDGVNLADQRLVVPVGVTCRTCERTDCAERALPSMRVPLRVDANRRALSLYMDTNGLDNPSESSS